MRIDVFTIFPAAVDAFAGFLGPHKRNERQTQAQDTARMALDRIAIQLRSAASAGGSASQPVEQHTDYDLVYLAPDSSVSTTNNPRGLQHVRYCLDPSTASNQKLWRQTTRYDSSTQASPPATTSCPGSAWTTSKLVASNLVNQLQSPAKPLFTTCSGSCYVTDVGINAVVDIDPTKPPRATDLQSKVSLRNLNRPPSAKLTCSASGNSRALCDASASTDPDGQTLTFAWAMNGGNLSGETSYRLDKPGLVSGTSYTFAVTVTDSAGLSSTASQPVLMP